MAAKKLKVVAYCRVSTSDQNVETQLSCIQKYCEAREWELAEVYTDIGISGAKEQRPALDRLKSDAANGKIKTVLVYKFDRMARNVEHLLECLELFRRNGIDFVSVSEGIDTSSSIGKMVFTFLGAVAEFERNLIRERVVAGVQRAKAEGVHCGRPRKGLDLALALSLHKQGKSVRSIAKEVHTSYASVHRYLKATEFLNHSVTASATS